MKTRFTARTLACAVALAAAPAHAFEFARGELTGHFDTTVTLGALWRAADRDPARIAITNGGTARSPNEDDGNLNWDRNELVSGLVKVGHDLELRYRTYGFFGRVLYFYDWAIDRKDNLPPEAKKRLRGDFELYDAFAFGQWDVAGGRRLNARLGNQVVSWGESTFIANGINVINPVDVAKLRAPGSELKEAFLPQPMAWASQEISETVALEGFYQAKYRKTRLEPRGTFFSTNDFVSPGGDAAYVGFGRRFDQNQPPVPPAGATAAVAQVWAPRLPDRDPSDSGQFGIVARIFLKQMNDTEVGLYAVNYHSRTPLVSSIRGTTTHILNAPGGGGTARYFAEFPEDIRLYGASFSTAGPLGIALQGEYSYRSNLPLQLSSIELLLATLGAANNITGDAASAAAVPVGMEISGFRRVKMQQVQATATKSFGPQLGAGVFVVVAEAGYTHLDLPEGLLFNGPSVFLPAEGSSVTTSFGSPQPGMQGYATNTSWGYRAVARLDYSNALFGATLSPRIAWAHDVRGVSPTFNEGTKAISVGLGINYQQNLQADISYTSYFGGRDYGGVDPVPVPAGQPQSFSSTANPLKDRDFLAINVSYSF
jgi:hypothetical protein